MYDFLDGQKKIFCYGLYAIGGNTPIIKDSYRVWKVSKSHMETLLYTSISTGRLYGFSWLENIRNEFETYDLAKNRR